MTDKTHQIIGLTATLGVYVAIHPSGVISLPIIGTIAFGSVIGSLAPDIDQPTDQLWRKIPLGGLFGHVTAVFLGGHRNLSHSLLGVALFGGLAWWIIGFMPDLFDHVIAWQSFMIGFLAHLVADSVTVMGVPLLWPLGGYMGFPPRPFQGVRIVTGKWFENWVIFPLVTLILGVLILVHLSRFGG